MECSLDRLIAEVTDLDRAVAFYRDLLGLPLVSQGANWAELQIGATRVRLQPPSGAGPHSGGWIVSLLVDDVEPIRERLERAGVRTRVGEDGAIHFEDPDANRLRIRSSL